MPLLLLFMHEAIYSMSVCLYLCNVQMGRLQHYQLQYY